MVSSLGRRFAQRLVEMDLAGARVVVFFFFKQKTAYEIDCDWSSDVCSSDLLPHPAEHRAGESDRAHPIYLVAGQAVPLLPRSEERRVGKECRSRWSPYH